MVNGSEVQVAYSSRLGAVPVSPKIPSSDLDCNEASQASITLDLIDLGIVLGTGLEYTLSGSSFPVAVESVYDLLSFSHADFRVTGYYKLDPNAVTTDGARAGPTTNFVGASGGLYAGWFAGLSRYKDWSVSNYSGPFGFVSMGVGAPLDLISVDWTRFWSLDNNVEGNLLGVSAGASAWPFIASAKSGTTNSIEMPGTLHKYRRDGREWPDYWDGAELAHALGADWRTGATLWHRAWYVIAHNAREWERLEEWQKAHPGQVWKQPS